MFRFENSNYFWLLLIIPIIIFLFLQFIKWRKKAIGSLGNIRLSNFLIEGSISGRTVTKFTLSLLTLLFCILALVNFQKGNQLQTIQQKGVDVFFALDVSKSMLAQDISPDRLTRAKLLIQTMMDKMANDRVGLILFAGRSYVQSPLTADYGTINMLLQSASPSSVPTQGTVINEAIKMAEESFNKNDKKYKTLIIISDGEDHEAEAVTAAKKAANQGIIIHTIGIGTTTGSTIFDPETNGNKVDNQGNEVISKLNEEALKEIADAGKGTYHFLGNNNQIVDKLMNQINKMEKRNIGEKNFQNFKSYYQYFLLIALVLLIVNSLLPNTRKNFEPSTIS